MQIFWGDKVNN